MLIVLPFVIPVFEAFGVNLVWFGLISVIAIEIGLLTPPLGIAVFVVKANLDDQSITVWQIFVGTMPMMLTMVTVLALCVLFPWLALAPIGNAVELVVGADAPAAEHSIDHLATGIRRPIMMRAKTEKMVKRWKDQRWAIDAAIQSVGIEWDQPRLGYTLYPAGPDAIGTSALSGCAFENSPTCTANSPPPAAAARSRRRISRSRAARSPPAKAISSPRCSIRRRAGRSSRTTRSRSTTTRAWCAATTSSRPL